LYFYAERLNYMPYYACFCDDITNPIIGLRGRLEHFQRNCHCACIILSRKSVSGCKYDTNEEFNVDSKAERSA